MRSLREDNIIRFLINIIVGIVLFQIVFGLLFNGSAALAIQSLVIVVTKLIKIIIILAAMAGILLLLKKFN